MYEAVLQLPAILPPTQWEALLRVMEGSGALSATKAKHMDDALQHIHIRTYAQFSSMWLFFFCPFDQTIKHLLTVIDQGSIDWSIKR